MKKILFLLFTIALYPGLLMAEEYSEGVEYTRYSKPFPVSTGDKIEVREVFWYGCPHCFNLEAPLNKWRKESMPANAEFVRMPAIFRENWIPHARAYYAFDALDQSEKLHHAIMSVMHVKKKRLMTKDQIADFIATQGVDRKEFLDAYNSFSVDSLSRQAGIMTKRYGITGVPSIIVDGRYLVSTKTPGGVKEQFKVVNYLVQKAAEARKNEEVKTK
ncbi:MAG: thiol:disulfide interchange protein DsbA/DsbL [Pseudomonadota bacterium]|nr:thiol:disulfide interchange protein DsbA/DsbL [Pseudomonadota bacterium]